MNKWETLPHEILGIIFLYLNSSCAENNKNDLAQCALTCRGWRANAQTVYFSTVGLSSIKQLNTMDRLISNNPMLGRWVKSLRLNLFEVEEDQLSKIDTLFPLIQKLQLDTFDASMLSLFYILVIEDGKFCNLKEIPKPARKSSEECDGLYIECLMFLKHRITHIDFNTMYHEQESETDIAAYEYLDDKLFQFLNLKEFRLYIYNEEESLYLYSFLDHLECLTKNGITSIEKYSLDFSVRCCTYLTTLAPFSTENLKSSPSIVPAVNVKQLNLYMSSDEGFLPHLLPNDEFLLYIMEKFPNLSSISFVTLIIDEGSELDYKHISKAVAIKFLKYVSKLSYGHIQRFITSSGDNTAKIIQGFYSDFEENSTLPTSRHLEIVYDDQRRPITVENVVENEHLRTLFIDFEAKQTEHKILIRPLSGCTAQSLFQQKVDLIEQTGRFFTHINLEISNSDYLTLLFKHVAEYCIQLNNLIIFCSREFEYNPFVYDMSLPRNHNIKALTLNGNLPSLEQLEYIINQLPSLKTLSFRISPYFKREGIFNGVFFSSIFLPNTSLKCLELHVDSIYHLYNRPPEIEGHHLKLVTESNEKSRYCLLINTRSSYGGSYNVISDSSMKDRFEENAQNKSISTLQIYCKSFEKFTIKYRSQSKPLGKMTEENLFSEDSSSNK